MNLRAIAATVVRDVLDGASLADALPPAIAQLPDKRDQALLQAICYGVCRWCERLESYLTLLLDKPLKIKDNDIYCLMMVGLYQLTEMRIPPHAAVGETVGAVDILDKSWAKGLVNAVLRNYQRQVAQLNKEVEQNPYAIYSHPDWIMNMAKQDWPNDWQDILNNNNQHPPFSIRVNQKNKSRDAYLAQLAELNFTASPIVETQCGITLSEPTDVNNLPGFAEGDVFVQDGAAQLAAELLDVQKGEIVLDACAAPGGKTTHLLERTPNLKKLIALDRDAHRLKSVEENLARLHLSAETVCADAMDTASWWDGELFDKILLDAPCSASGVIRRHPDIKLLRREEDILELAQEQLKLLNALWPTLKPGGLMLYATCSFFHLENMRVIESFFAMTPDVKEEKIKSSWGKECTIGKQILPGMHGMDGFYFACLRKSLPVL